MGFAEIVSKSCHSSNLKAEDDRIGSIEHVAALSGASSIGSDMMRAKDHDASALRRAVLLLASKVRHQMRLGMGPSQQLATAAILECMYWQCRLCNGASELVANGVRKTCQACGGVGVHHWTNAERANAAGYPGANWPMWEKKYEQVLSMARLIDSSTLHQVRKRLG